MLLGERSPASEGVATGGKGPVWRTPEFGIAVLSSMAIVLRVVGVGRLALWSDELQRITWAKGYEFDRVFNVLASETGVRSAPQTLDRALDVVSAHNPPLNGALLNLWLRLTGDPSDAVARFPSVAFSAAAVPVTYAALRRRFGETAALLTAGLVALSPWHAYYAQEVNHYALGFLATAITFYFYFRYEAAPSIRVGVGWVLAATVALYTHYYTAIVIVCQWVALALGKSTRRPSLGMLLWPPLVLTALALPYVPMLKKQLSEMTDTAQIGKFSASFPYVSERIRATLVIPFLGELGNYVSWLVALPIIAFSIGLLGLGLSRVDRSDRRLLAINLIGPFVIVGVAFFVFEANSILWPRYQLFFSFMIYTCAGVALAGLAHRTLWAAAPLVVLAVVGHVHQHGVVHEDWRTVAGIIDRSAPRNEPVLVYRQNLVYAVARYLRGKNRLFGIGPGPNMEKGLQAIVAADRTATGIWYVSAWPEANDMEPRMQAFLVRSYERCDKQPVDPGTVSMQLTHCSVLRAADRETPSWWLARTGPRAEGGWVEQRTPSAISGWAYSSAGLRAIRIVLDGKTIAEAPHLGFSRPDVSRAFSSLPQDLTEPSGFSVNVHLAAADAARAHVLGIRADGTSLELPGASKP